MDFISPLSVPIPKGKINDTPLIFKEQKSTVWEIKCHILWHIQHNSWRHYYILSCHFRVYLADNRVPDIFFFLYPSRDQTERNYFHQELQWHSISDLVIDLTLRNKTFKVNLLGCFFNWKQISMSIFDYWVESTRLSLIGVGESFWVRIL